MKFTQKAREDFLKTVLNNFHEYGFSYRSVIDEDGGAQHGLTVERIVSEVFDLGIAHITLTNTTNRGRKIGLLVVNEADGAPADLIADYGAANKNDLEIADRCIQGAPVS